MKKPLTKWDELMGPIDFPLAKDVFYDPVLNCLRPRKCKGQYSYDKLIRVIKT